VEGKRRGRKKAEKRSRAGKGGRMTLFFPSLSRDMQMSAEGERTTEKLKWTPPGIFSMRNEQDEREKERGSGGSEMEFL